MEHLIKTIRQFTIQSPTIISRIIVTDTSIAVEIKRLVQ
jgi:hypothetical protein